MEEIKEEVKDTEKKRVKFLDISKEEQERRNKQTEYRSNFVLRIYRLIKNNKDLVALVIIVFCFTITGYWIAKFEFGLTSEQIKTETRDLIEFLGFLILGLTAFAGKLFMAQGTITASLSKSANKESDNLGNTRKPSL